MNLERYTEKTQSILQASQTLALGHGHQKFLPEHLLQAMLLDQDDLVQKLVHLCDGNIQILSGEIKQVIDRIPSVEGSGAGQISLSQELARIFLLAEKISDQNSDQFVTV